VRSPCSLANRVKNKTAQSLRRVRCESLRCIGRYSAAKTFGPMEGLGDPCHQPELYHQNPPQAPDSDDPGGLAGYGI
jgi:hypothetical protein